MLARIDELIEAGRLRSTGGAFPKLELANAGAANADAAHAGPADAGAAPADTEAARASRRVAMAAEREPLRVGVLASGTGTNLQALLDTLHGREIVVAGVATDRPDAIALERAKTAGIESAVFVLADYADRPARDTAIADWMAERGVELIVLAGYMAILTSPFLQRFDGGGRSTSIRRCCRRSRACGRSSRRSTTA